MERKKLNKIAKSFFDRNKDLKGMFATASGHFFYGKADRDTFIKQSEKHEKPVNYTPGSFEDKKPNEDKGSNKAPDVPKVFSFDKCPAGEILKKRGFKSVAELKAVPELSKLPGIGEKKAEEIKEYLKNFE